MNIRPLNDLERFEVMQAMFPEEIADDNGAWDNIEDTIWEKFEIDGEHFDLLVGHLAMLAPVQQSPLTGSLHHVLGTVKVVGDSQMITAAVKREVQPPKTECDHDWETVGDGKQVCTYPNCNETREHPNG